ncbi:hypothetical protein EYF80_040095 [Liparis tanakae]|uniref:Uncharacterized protein n=1 Tax=Liparis tanakae TaxID=230148 RepID=A0A4Z2G938_9TELE|nr:hypothetical protein EYF80_040095 [Liparis tanakae]
MSTHASPTFPWFYNAMLRYDLFHTTFCMSARMDSTQPACTYTLDADTVVVHATAASATLSLAATGAAHAAARFLLNSFRLDTEDETPSAPESLAPPASLAVCQCQRSGPALQQRTHTHCSRSPRALLSQAFPRLGFPSLTAVMCLLEIDASPEEGPEHLEMQEEGQQGFSWTPEQPGQNCSPCWPLADGATGLRDLFSSTLHSKETESACFYSVGGEVLFYNEKCDRRLYRGIIRGSRCPAEDTLPAG